jgi:transposase
MFIAYTPAFTLFSSHKPFAWCAGIVLFAYSSGSSIRGRTKVSHLANKKMKTILNMAVLTAKKVRSADQILLRTKSRPGKEQNACFKYHEVQSGQQRFCSDKKKQPPL